MTDTRCYRNTVQRVFPEQERGFVISSKLCHMMKYPTTWNPRVFVRKSPALQGPSSGIRKAGQSLLGVPYRPHRNTEGTCGHCQPVQKQPLHLLVECFSLLIHSNTSRSCLCSPSLEGLEASDFINCQKLFPTLTSSLVQHYIKYRYISYLLCQFTVLPSKIMKWVSTAQKRVANFFIFNGEMFSNARCYDSGSGAFTGF